MSTRNIVLTDHQDALVSKLVKAGRYQNASEVLREGLRLVEAKELEYQEKLLRLREALATGVADMEAGRTVTLGTGEEITDYLSKRAEEIADKGK